MTGANPDRKTVPRIWHQSVNELDHFDVYKRALEAHAAEILGEDAKVIVHGLPSGSYGGASATAVLGNPFAYHRILDRVIDYAIAAERQGYDAFVASATTTGKNLLSNPRAAFGEGDAPDPGQTWDDAKGIQIVGNVVHLDGAEADAAAAALMAKYSHLGEAIKQSHLFRLDPTRVKYLHNAPDGDEAFETLGVNWVIEEF